MDMIIGLAILAMPVLLIVYAWNESWKKKTVWSIFTTITATVFIATFLSLGNVQNKKDKLEEQLNTQLKWEKTFTDCVNSSVERYGYNKVDGVADTVTCALDYSKKLQGID